MLGLFVKGTAAGSTTFGDGVLCLGSNVLRLDPVIATSSSGTASLGAGFALSNGLSANSWP